MITRRVSTQPHSSSIRFPVQGRQMVHRFSSLLVNQGCRVTRFLYQQEAYLPDHRYRPLAARLVWIPKPGMTERLPLSIRDRIVQAALKMIIEPILEADFQPCSFEF